MYMKRILMIVLLVTSFCSSEIVYFTKLKSNDATIKNVLTLNGNE